MIENVKHVAIILDGNRRWAKSKGMLPQLGHKEGAKNLETFSKEANKLGLKYLTVYCFSTENWKRSKEEVNYLMKLFRFYIKRIAKESGKENIRVRFFGSNKFLDKKMIQMKEEAENNTKNNTGLCLNICFNYGGRLELVEAIQKISQKVLDGNIDIEDINEEEVIKNLYSFDTPDPDILIRTSGEQRLSNFLPWQLTYAEFFFVQKHWPEFKKEDLEKIIEEFNNRNRRFGAG